MPFVLPRLLEAGLTAVVAAVDLGEHMGYAISHVDASHRADVEPTSTWGLLSYPRFDEDGTFLGYGQRDDEDDYDYDLVPWIRSGRLLWIAPDDPTYRLRRGTRGCDYLELDGRREVARIRGGRVTWSG